MTANDNTAVVIPLSVQRMVCTGCGAEASASCNCGLNYVPKAVRAAEVQMALIDLLERQQPAMEHRRVN